MTGSLTIRSTLPAILALVLSGCAHLYDPIDDSLTCLQCEMQAHHTWRYLRCDYAGVVYPHHFGAGFRAGYVNVCRGGSGCPPTLPPKCYWTIWYRNEVGRAKTVEWFNGYSAGAAVAMSDGRRQFAQLATAPGLTAPCDCGESVQYDLSDLSSSLSPTPPSLPDEPAHEDSIPHDPEAESGPTLPDALEPSPDADAALIPESAVSRTLPPTEAPPSEQRPLGRKWGHSTDQSPYQPSPDSSPSRLTPALVPPATDEPMFDEPATEEPESQQWWSEPDVSSPPSEPVPFGHSPDTQDSSTSDPSSSPQAASQPAADEPVTNAAPVDLPPLPDTWTLRPSAPSRSPAPIGPAPQNPARNPDPGSRDVSLPGSRPAPVSPQQPPGKFPPLEDRFLPRPRQSSQARTSRETSLQMQIVPRTGSKSTAQIERTSYPVPQ